MFHLFLQCQQPLISGTATLLLSAVLDSIKKAWLCPDKAKYASKAGPTRFAFSLQLLAI